MSHEVQDRIETPLDTGEQCAASGDGAATEAEAVTGAEDVALTVNGSIRRAVAEPRHLLVDTLRAGCGLTGTRAGCHEGICGTCTVLLGDLPTRSCLVLAHEVREPVTTVEALEGDPEGDLIRSAFARHHALQCGYCTAGFMMLALAMLRSGQRRTVEDVRTVASSNLCRCTGYRPIVAALVDIVAARDLLDGDEVTP